jgi:predicted MFS family arabinose efflux permease
MWQEARAGIGYVVSNRYLRSIAACTGTANLFGNLSAAVLILYLVRTEDGLGLTPGTIGVILALGNTGVIVGALTAGRLARAIGIGPTIIVSAALAGVSAFAVPLAPRDDPFWVLVAGGLIAGYSVVAYNVNQVGLRQAITPDRMLGRMNATMRLIVWGTIPVGALIGGMLGVVLGLQSALWVAAVGASLSFLPVLLSPVRTLREIPAGAE